MSRAYGRATQDADAGASVVDLDLRRAAAAELATSARNGSDAAFQELARRLGAVMGRIEANYYLPGGDRDDLRQESLYGLHKATHDWRAERGPFLPFAAGCIYRQVVTAVKAATRKKHRPLNERADPSEVVRVDDGEAIALDELPVFADPASDPHDVLTAREDFDTFVCLARGSTSELEGEVLGLWLSGLSYDEISERTGRNFKQIDNAMQRLRRKFSSELAVAA